MSDFVIPNGKEFRFKIKVIEKDSLLPQDVGNLDLVNSSVKFMNPATNVCIVPVALEDIAIAIVPDDVLANPFTYLNGIISVVVPASYTAQMIIDRGDKVDGYYLKPTYQGIFDLVFTDTTPNRVVVLDKVYVIPASC
jgi:hypothetical protein